MQLPRIRSTVLTASGTLTLVTCLTTALFPALYPSVGRSQTVEWARSGGGASNDFAYDIDIDDAGNSYVVGRYEGSATFGPFTLTAARDKDMFVVKYDADGNVIWARTAGGTAGNDIGYAIAVDSVGNSYVTGFIFRHAFFGPSLTATGGFEEIFLAKYDADGNIQWVQSAGGTSGDDRGEGVAVDAAGNSYVTGYFSGKAMFGAFTLIGSDDVSLFVAKFDANGDVLWAHSPGDGIGRAIAVDAAGNSYMTGLFVGTATFGSFVFESDGVRDICVAKYDPDGNILWARAFGGPAGDDRGTGITVDVEGNCYVTGRCNGCATFGSVPLIRYGGVDTFAAKLDAEGNVLWARLAGNASSSDGGEDIAVDTAGNSYATGYYANTGHFGPFTFTSSGLKDFFLTSYDADGQVRWARSEGGIWYENGRGIAVDAAGHIYVAGYFGTLSPDPPFVYLTTIGPITLGSAGSYDMFVVKYIPCGNGTIDPGEACDDAGETAACDVDCTLPECGDNTVNVSAGEQCDGGLSCIDCVCDSGFVPSVPPSVDCLSLCGNGVVDPGENCDDGNVDDSDFCLSTCEINSTIPAVSEWGLAAMTLLTLGAGTVLVRRRTGFAQAEK